MPVPNQTFIMELPSGVVDGVNNLFETSRDYQPGTLQSFLRGIPRTEEGAEKGVEELGGRSFRFVPEAPEDEDMTFVGYSPTV